jgi:hypothetical protein
MVLRRDVFDRKKGEKQKQKKIKNNLRTLDKYNNGREGCAASLNQTQNPLSDTFRQVNPFFSFFYLYTELYP